MGFIDSHVHYVNEDPWEYIETLLRRMDEHDIEKAVLFGVQGHPLCGDGAVLHVVRKYPDRFIPFACSVRCEYERDAEVFLDYLADGPWVGVGEIYVDLAHQKPTGFYADRYGKERRYTHYWPVDKQHNAVYRRVFEYCRDHGLPVMVHCLGIDTMEDLLRVFPSTSFVWAHADWALSEGDTIPMLGRYPNLYCDIGAGFRFEAGKLLRGEFGADEDWLPRRFAAWQSAAREHPTRILWGSDIFIWWQLDEQICKEAADLWDLFSEPLSEETRIRIRRESVLSLIQRT